jgi:hypothetical protein
MLLAVVSANLAAQSIAATFQLLAHILHQMIQN